MNTFEEITLNAYAKINLILDVLRKRPDGYHDVKMIMQTVDLYDTINIKKSNESRICLTIENEYQTDFTDSFSMPDNENNIIYKAAALFKNEYGLDFGLNIKLIKRIPIAAGMAGGSSDAAAVIKGLNILSGKNLSISELCKLGVKIGADVPYCITGGTMLSEGIGDILTPLEPVPKLPCLIVKPNEGISTKYVYEHLNLMNASHPNVENMISAITNKNIQKIFNSMENILETVTLNICPSISKIKHDMLRAGANASLMSGSGPTVFGLFTDKSTAENAFNKFKKSEFSKNTFLTYLK